MVGSQDDKRYVRQRGDLVWLNFNPQAGREQAGLRPAIVISPQNYNARVGLCIVCPITNQAKGYPFEFATRSKHVTGVILSDHIRNVDWKARQIEFHGRARQEVINEVLQKIKCLIDA